MRRLNKATVVASLVALVAALAACGDKTIDQGKAEDLARKIADSGTVKTKSVECPSDVKVEEGKTFDCDLEYGDGAKGTITMHMTDDDGTVRTTGADVKVEGQ
jgi:uncharacterized lipoprotein YehR (DUF1307 family)